MDTVISGRVGVKPARRTSTRLYTQMDREAWPDKVPPLTEAEAKTAARLLFRRFHTERFYQERHGMSRAAYYRKIGKTPPPYKLKVSMNGRRRHAWVGWNRIELSPGQGWHGMVHSLSHRIHSQLRPNDAGHGDNHRRLERDMIEHVVASGWLDGKLKPKPRTPRPPKPVEPKPDPVIAEHDKAVARVKAWRTRLRRAKTGLANAQKTERKLRRKRQRTIRFIL